MTTKKTFNIVKYTTFWIKITRHYIKYKKERVKTLSFLYEFLTELSRLNFVKERI
jgi:hypothetical protein